MVNALRKLLKDPQAVFKYQQQLRSKKLELKNQQLGREKLQRKLNELPQIRQNILFQHQIGELDGHALQAKLAKLSSQKKELTEKLVELEKKITSQVFDKHYQQSLELFADKYKQVLDQDINTNRKELAEVISMLVDEIILYSRPVTAEDKLAGRKKEGQYIPYKLDIKLNLPQYLMRDFYTDITGAVLPEKFADFERIEDEKLKAWNEERKKHPRPNPEYWQKIEEEADQEYERQVGSSVPKTFGEEPANLSGRQDSNLRPLAPHASILAI